MEIYGNDELLYITHDGLFLIIIIVFSHTLTYSIFPAITTSSSPGMLSESRYITIYIIISYVHIQ